MYVRHPAHVEARDRHKTPERQKKHPAYVEARDRHKAPESRRKKVKSRRKIKSKRFNTEGTEDTEK